MDERGSGEKQEKLSPCMVGYIRDKMLSGCTYQEVKEGGGLQVQKTVLMMKGKT